MFKKNGCNWSWFAWILVIIGAVNWGLVGLGSFFESNWNLVNLILGNWPVVENVVYILVGICGVILIFGCRCKTCNAHSMGMESHSGAEMKM